VTHRITPNVHVHDADAPEDIHQNSIPDKSHIAIEMFSPVRVTRAFQENFDLAGTMCSFCKRYVDECECWICEGEYIFCDQCGFLKGLCICSEFSLCPVCGRDPCQYWENMNKCYICGCSPCQCNAANSYISSGGGSSSSLFIFSPYGNDILAALSALTEDIMDNCMGGNLYIICR